MKTIGVMQPYFMPYIGYWQLMNLVDEYIIFDDVNYIKRGWINRNSILFNGEAKRINLQIKDASQNRLIKDTMIAQTEKEIDSLLHIIKQAYAKAPYFEETYALLERILRYGERNLALYLQNQILMVCDYLGIKTDILLSSDIEKNIELKGEDKIIDICRRRKAERYINAIGGKALYHQDKFKEYGIELKFLKTNDIQYKQFEETFYPNLSIIDVLMFNSKNEIGDLMAEFSLEK